MELVSHRFEDSSMDTTIINGILVFEVSVEAPSPIIRRVHSEVHESATKLNALIHELRVYSQSEITPITLLIGSYPVSFVPVHCHAFIFVVTFLINLVFQSFVMFLDHLHIAQIKQLSELSPALERLDIVLVPGKSAGEITNGILVTATLVLNHLLYEAVSILQHTAIEGTDSGCEASQGMESSEVGILFFREELLL